MIYHPLDSTLKLSLGHRDGPPERTRRIPEDLVPTAAHLRAPVHPDVISVAPLNCGS